MRRAITYGLLVILTQMYQAGVGRPNRSVMVKGIAWSPSLISKSSGTRIGAGSLRCSPRVVLYVTVPAVTLAHKVGPGLQDLQTRARRILAERNAEKAEENTWIGRMVAAESLEELDGLIKSHAT